MRSEDKSLADRLARMKALNEGLKRVRAESRDQREVCERRCKELDAAGRPIEPRKF
jgi:hypothetical protein